MKGKQAVKMILVLLLALGMLSVGAAAISYLPDPGFSIQVPDGWRAGRGDLLRPSIGGSDDSTVIRENEPNPDTVIIEGEMEGEEGVKLFLLNEKSLYRTVSLCYNSSRLVFHIQSKRGADRVRSAGFDAKARSVL